MVLRVKGAHQIHDDELSPELVARLKHLCLVFGVPYE